jgi:hypothetical protein
VALSSAIAVLMIASGTAVHSREAPLQIVCNVHAVVAMAECRRSLFSEPIPICDCTPNVQVKPFLVSQGIGADSNWITALSHFSMGRNQIASCDNAARANTDFQISVRSELMFDEPFCICGWKIARVTNLNVSDSLIAIVQHVDASRPNAHIGALENFCVFSLPPRNRRQDDSKNANNERKQRCDFVMVGLNERVSDPIPITPDRIEHERTLFFIALFCVLLVVLKQPSK